LTKDEIAHQLSALASPVLAPSRRRVPWDGATRATLRYVAVLMLGLIVGQLEPTQLGSPPAPISTRGILPAHALLAPATAQSPSPETAWVTSSNMFSSDLLESGVEPLDGRVIRTGELAIEDAGAPVRGLASVKIDARWGYMDRTGRLIAPPRFEEAGWFSAGTAAVKLDGRWGYIDQSGRLIIEPQFDDAGGFSRDLAPVRVGDRWGYIDRTGRMIIPPQFERAHSFIDAVTAVKIDGRWVFIDVTGRIVLDPQASRDAGRS
jgi:hypothetical protein